MKYLISSFIIVINFICALLIIECVFGKWEWIKFIPSFIILTLTIALIQFLKTNKQ